MFKIKTYWNRQQSITMVSNGANHWYRICTPAGKYAKLLSP